MVRRQHGARLSQPARAVGPVGRAWSAPAASAAAALLGTAALLWVQVAPAAPFAAPAGAVTGAAAAGKSARVIWLHGLGDTAAGWAFLPQYLEARGLGHVDFVLPTAPSIPITINGGMVMPGWFDMADLPYSSASVDDRESIESIGVDRLGALIAEAEAEGFPADRIVVGGFSQGGCVAMLAGLAYPRTLAGVASLSGWLPAYSRADISAVLDSSAARPPILWGHGEADPTVFFDVAKLGPPVLEQAGVPVDFRGFPGLGHGADEAELEWLAEWLKQSLPPL